MSIILFIYMNLNNKGDFTEVEIVIVINNRVWEEKRRWVGERLINEYKVIHK